MQRFRWIANLRNDSIGRHRLVNPHRFSREIGSVRQPGNGSLGIIESDTAGEVVGGTYGRGKRATIRPIRGGISCRF